MYTFVFCVRTQRITLSFLLFIFLSTLRGYGQDRSLAASKNIPKYLMALGEYQCFFLNTRTGRLYGVSSNQRLLANGDNLSLIHI